MNPSLSCLKCESNHMGKSVPDDPISLNSVPEIQMTNNAPNPFGAEPDIDFCCWPAEDEHFLSGGCIRQGRNNQQDSNKDDQDQDKFPAHYPTSLPRFAKYALIS